MKKVRLSVYLDPQIMVRLAELAKSKGMSKSPVAEAAIASLLTSGDADRHEAALVRKLDELTRQVNRLERDHSIAVEALALFIRFWLIVTPSLPQSAQSAAQAKGRERYESFLETLGRRLAKRQSFLQQVSSDNCVVCDRSRDAHPLDRKSKLISEEIAVK
jgi:predicted transcriptional regulator